MKKIVVIFYLVWFFSQLAVANQLPVYVSILPLKYFVERIGGDKVQVNVMVGPGQSPETYAPTPQQMVAISQSALYFRVGVPFEEAWIGKIHLANPRMPIIDLRQNIELHKLAAETDPHIWTSPVFAMQMAKTILYSLDDADAENIKYYTVNYKKFEKELKKTHRYIWNRLKKIKNRTFLDFHPAWGCFADAYNLKQISIEKHGASPGPKGLANIVEQAKQNEIMAVFVQPQFNQSQVKMVAEEIGAHVVSIDPLAEDYIENMRNVADVFALYLK